MRARTFVFSVLVAIVLRAPLAVASTYSSEITDMWWNPAESGWGVNVIMQNNVAFMTFFIYDQNQNPVWYTAQLTGQPGFVYAGPLYATKGPWFGGPFPPSNVTVRQAGTATFTLADLNTAAFIYSIDGVAVSKTLQRQTFANENFSGNYAGGYSIRASNCNPSYINGIQEVAGVLSVSQTGNSVAMSASASNASCTFSGGYTQIGKLGSVTGTYSCTDGTRGSFTAYEMTPTVSGFTARVQGVNQYCQWSGYLGGIRRAP